MFEVVEDLKEYLEDGTIKENDLSIYFVSHLELWLACLYVVIEGYEELGLTDPAIDKLIPKNREVLRRLRNYALHYTPDIRRFYDFIDARVDGQLSLNWARDLHSAFREFIFRYCTDEKFRDVTDSRKSFFFTSTPSHKTEII
jgi:hypothetical protein